MSIPHLIATRCRYYWRKAMVALCLCPDCWNTLNKTQNATFCPECGCRK